MVSGHAVGTKGAQVTERLNEVRFPLAVAADEEVRSGIQCDVESLVVPEVREGEMGDDH